MTSIHAFLRYNASAITFQSVNGRDVTFINGANNTDSCVILESSSSVIEGFTITNNIVYFNTAVAGANFTNTAGNTGLNYSCVFPTVDGTGNITNDPRLIGLAGGDYRLHMSSPCVNTGTNQDWMTNAVDLEGNAHILNNIVDMGCYETVLWQGTIYRIP